MKRHAYCGCNGGGGGTNRDHTFNGIERLAVRIIASAIPYAYHGCRDRRMETKIKVVQLNKMQCTKHC